MVSPTTHYVGQHWPRDFPPDLTLRGVSKGWPGRLTYTVVKTDDQPISQMSFSPLCCHTAEVCQGKHTRREKGSHREPTGHHGGPWVTLGDHDQGLRGQTLSRKGLQQCSIDQGHGPRSGRSSGFQRQRVTPVWAAQWPPGSGSQGDHPCRAHSKGVTSADRLPRFKKSGLPLAHSKVR